MWCGSKPYLAWVYCWFLNAASRGFSPDTPVFSFSSKTNMFNLNISPIRWGHLRGQERNDTEEREISAGLRCVFYHACTGVSLTTSNGLVTCDTTYWTGLHENNCGLKFPACSLDRAREFHINLNRFWKPSSFDDRCGRRLHQSVGDRQRFISSL